MTPSKGYIRLVKFFSLSTVLRNWIFFWRMCQILHQPPWLTQNWATLCKDVFLLSGTWRTKFLRLVLFF